MLSTQNLKTPGTVERLANLGYLQVRKRVISSKVSQPHPFMQADIGWGFLLRDPEETRKLFEKYNPTHVIHLAALGELARNYIDDGPDL